MVGFGYELPSLLAGGGGITCIYNSSTQDAEAGESAQGHPGYIASLRSAWAKMRKG